MEVVKQTSEFKIFKKRNGRYGVRGKDGKWINGIPKVKILNQEGLIKVAVPKAPPPEVAPPAAEAAAEETTETSGEEVPQE